MYGAKFMMEKRIIAYIVYTVPVANMVRPVQYYHNNIRARDRAWERVYAPGPFLQADQI